MDGERVVLEVVRCDGELARVKIAIDRDERVRRRYILHKSGKYVLPLPLVEDVNSWHVLEGGFQRSLAKEGQKLIASVSIGVVHDVGCRDLDTTSIRIYSSKLRALWFLTEAGMERFNSLKKTIQSKWVNEEYRIYIQAKPSGS
ncbi:hypothetical protein SUGI_1156080 [Cryptomeria japonica]|nr:hypothetical protein SUGI_1156080 [Cryptomeria japonica]